MPPRNMQPNKSSAPRLIGVLDPGTSKVVCLALTKNSAAGERLRLAGFAQRASAGIVAGEVVDPVAAATAIVSAVAEAERTAGAEIDALYVAVAAGRMALTSFSAEVGLDPTIVQATDIAKLMTSARAYVERDGRLPLHVATTAYLVDDWRSAIPPLARFGRHLSAEVTAITADASVVHRMLRGVASTGLPIERLVPGPLVAAMAVTTPGERASGMAVLDLGAGATTVTIFAAGQVAAVHTIALGAHQLTGDVARAHQISLTEAERIKALYGRVGPAHAGDPHALVHRIGSGSNTDHRPSTIMTAAETEATRALLCETLTPRVETLLRLAADRLDASIYAADGIGRVVLTGGGSQLDGLSGYAAHLLGRPVRLGRPVGFPGLEAIATPANAAAVGLARCLDDAAIGIARPAQEATRDRRAG